MGEFDHVRSSCAQAKIAGLGALGDRLALNLLLDEPIWPDVPAMIKALLPQVALLELDRAEFGPNGQTECYF